MGRIKIGLAAVASVAAVGTAAGAIGVPAAAAGPLPAARHSGAAMRAHMVRVPGLAPSALAGYLWSTSATNSGLVDPYWAFNSAGQAVLVTNPVVGEYLVTFNGLGHMTTAAPEVTVYNTSATCTAADWGSFGGNWVAAILCFSLGGAPQNARFDLAVSKPVTAPRGVLDYAEDYLFHSSGPLTGLHSYNSSHKTNSSRHLGTGRYKVTMPGPGTRGMTGTVKVTATGVQAGDCELAGWHGTTTGQVIYVDCFAAAGVPQDSGFDVTYARGNNLMGLNGVTTANAFADRPTVGRYEPSIQYDSHRNARVTSVRLMPGSYQVYFAGSEGPGNSNGGDVQVSAVGHTDDHCYVVRWVQATTPYAYVDCVSKLGGPIDSAFAIEWVVA